MTIAILDARDKEYVVVATGTDLLATYVQQAILAGQTAQEVLDAILAAGAAVGVFPSTAAGIAGTTNGQYFWVGSGSAITLYQNSAGTPIVIASVGSGLFVTTRASLPTANIGGAAYATDVNAYYRYVSGSSATVDGWGVIAALGGVGRWLLASDGVTVHAIGGGADDGPTLMAAGDAMAALGRTLVTPDALYTIDTIWAWPRAPLTLIAHPGVTFEATLTPNGQPATAPFYCSAGGSAIVATGALTSNAIASAVTVAISVQPSVGQYLRVRDNVSGAQVISGQPVEGFTGSTYQVRAVSGSGPYTVTLDRPLRFPLAIGDEAVILSDIAKGHRVIGRPTIKGTAVRAVEFVGVWDCDLDVRIVADGLTDVGGSFDLFGYRNRVRGEVIKTTGSCKDGWLLESNERSEMELTVKGFAAGTGISIFHGIDCVDRSDCSGNDIGGALRGYGIHGCIGSELAGRYDRNASQGAGVINGSVGSRVTGWGRYNPINLAVGDISGGNVANTSISGDWSGGTTAGVVVAASAIGTTADTIDTSDSDIGILANGSITAAIHRHHGEVDASVGGTVVATDDAVVNIASVDYDVDEVSNTIRSSNNAVVRLSSGRLRALGGSNLIRPGGNSGIELGDGFVAATSDGTGNVIYFDSTTAKVSIARGASVGGVVTLAAGSAGRVDRDGRFSTNIGNNGTTAVTTEEILKDFTFPAASLKVGQKIRVRAWGTVAANANTKTVRLYFGPSGSLSALAGPSITTGSAFAWYLDAEIWLTGAATQDFAVRVNNGNSAQVVGGQATKALSSALIVSLRGQNGTASANDIVARGLEVEVVS